MKLRFAQLIFKSYVDDAPNPTGNPDDQPMVGLHVERSGGVGVEMIAGLATIEHNREIRAFAAQELRRAADYLESTMDTLSFATPEAPDADAEAVPSGSASL